MSLLKVDRSHKESLLKTIEELDLAFSEGRAKDVGELFAADGLLMWSQKEDIVGRDSIIDAFAEFMSKFKTSTWEPKRELIDVYEKRAYTLGTFIEIMTPSGGGPTMKVYGRLVEVWQLSFRGEWELIRQMTGRYADPEEIEILK